MDTIQNSTLMAEYISTFNQLLCWINGSVHSHL